MVSNSKHSFRRFLFSACLCVILAAMGAMMGGCGINYSTQNKLRSEIVDKGFPCTLHLTTDDIERKSDQIVCDNQVYLVGSLTTTEVINELARFKLNFGSRDYPAQVFGKIATEEISLLKGSVKAPVIQIDKIVIEMVMELTTIEPGAIGR